MEDDLKIKILIRTYKKETRFLKSINGLGKLPYLPYELLEYIFQFLPTTTDYIDFYIEKHFYIEKYYNEVNSSNDLMPYILQLHNNPKKEELCKHWSYGEAFLHISKRHENKKSFYSRWNNWEQSFLSDIKQQITFISKPRSAMSEKEMQLMAYITPICTILRINWGGHTAGIPIQWEIELGPHFQTIINLPSTEQIELLTIWNSSYAKSFTNAMEQHRNNRKKWFSKDPNASWMCSFVTEFMHYYYH